MEVVRGKIQRYLETLATARKNGVTYIWSGDLRRNEYLRDCLSFAVKQNIVKAKWIETDQESGYDITWRSNKT